MMMIWSKGNEVDFMMMTYFVHIIPVSIGPVSDLTKSSSGTSRSTNQQPKFQPAPTDKSTKPPTGDSGSIIPSPLCKCICNQFKSELYF